jgi:hypothetical protein
MAEDAVANGTEQPDGDPPPPVTGHRPEQLRCRCPSRSRHASG